MRADTDIDPGQFTPSLHLGLADREALQASLKCCRVGVSCELYG